MALNIICNLNKNYLHLTIINRRQEKEKYVFKEVGSPEDGNQTREQNCSVL